MTTDVLHMGLKATVNGELNVEQLASCGFFHGARTDGADEDLEILTGGKCVSKKK